MGMHVKTLRMTVSVFALILASVAPSAAQANVHVTGNTSFTVTWQAAKQNAPTFLAEATFTVSGWTGTSFTMTVTGVQNTMPVLPDIQARLTAFGFGLMPLGQFSNQVDGSLYHWSETNFPQFNSVDVCLAITGATCGGVTAPDGGLGQGQSSPETYSITINGAFPNGVTITPIPARFTANGSAGTQVTDGVLFGPVSATDLTIAKVHGPSIALPGQTVTYDVTVTNTGNLPSSGSPVTVIENPPPGLTVTALSGGGWTCAVPTRTCTRSVSDALNPGASYPPITVTTSVGAGVASGTLTNTAVVSGGGDSNAANNTATDPTVIGGSPSGMDLSITKTHTPITALPGQTITYTVTVANVGTSPTSGPVTVTDTPPSGLTITALSGVGWTTCTVATHTCTRSDPLAPNLSYPVITVTADVGAGVAPGTLVNTAVVSGGGDTTPANNTATDSTVITASGASDLTISKTHNPDIAIPGATVTYTVTVSNVGTAASTGPVTVTETPPPGLTVTALIGGGWNCTVATPTSTCTRSDALAAGASYSPIAVTTSVASGAAAGVVTNTAVVSGGGDSNTTNNTATDPTIIAVPAPGIDLTITKRHSPQTVVPGQTFTYTIAVSNVGGTASSGAVTVTETPPAGLTVTALAGAGWACTVATPASTCTRSDALAPATSYPGIIVTTSVGAGVSAGTVVNTAVVSGGGDINNGNNTATDPTVINSPVGGPELTLTKTPSASVVVPGQTVTFTLRVMNVGNAPTSGTITVQDTAPATLTVTALSGTGWTCLVATRTCFRADALAQGASYPEITVTAVVAPNAAGTVVNGAVVTGGGDTNPGNGSATAPIEVEPAAAGSDLALAKTRTDSGILLPGQPVSFTIRATNVGGSPTSGTVTVTETPPAGLTITALSGSGWTCSVATRTCTRADALAPLASYPDISVTANIAVNAAGTLVNSAAVSGGGDSSAGNNTATSPITIGPSAVPTLPVAFMIALMSALLGIALLGLRARRLRGL
jgi:uncharacterized repeat protein (TIGR01451 family)